MRINFIGPSYIARSRNIAFDECINYYPENSEQGTAKNVRALIGTPGLELWATPTVTGAGRGVYQPSGSYNTSVYAVVGDKLYKYSGVTATETEIGTLSTTTGQVRFADSGSSQTTGWMFLVDGLKGYTLNMDDLSFSEVTLPTSVTPSWCTFQDGYFIINDTGSLTCYYSAQWDASSWTGTDAFTFESAPDNCTAIIAHDGNLWPFGTNSHEVFYNAGSAASQLFLRISGTPSDIGTVAPQSLAYNGTQLFWMGANRFGTTGIYMSQGLDGVQISTPSIDFDLDGDYLFDAVGYCYSQEGHNFYVINFPNANKTWCFDASTGYWHRRTHLSSGNENRHRVISAINVNSGVDRGYVLGQDWETGLLYKMKLDVYTDNGDEIRRVRSCPTVHADRQRLSFSSFQVDMETGVGLSTGQGSDPKGIIQITNDSGHTWGNEIEVGLGKIGEYTYRAKINRLGQARDRGFRFICTDPIKQVLVGGFAEAQLDG